MNVTLEAVTPETRHILENFFTVYFFDLSQYDDQIVINPHGLPVWEPFGLPGPRTPTEHARYNWWIRDDCEQYLIRVEDVPAGFAVVLADSAHLPADVDFDLIDFYITPKFRRQGIGQQAAVQVFEKHRGTWLVNELPRNQAALLFWHSVIGSYTNENYTDMNAGTIQRFSNA